MWRDAELGKDLVFLVVVMVLLLTVAGNGLQIVAMVEFGGSFVLFGFSIIFSFMIIVFLCWGLYAGKPWGWWFSALRFGVMVLILNPVMNILNLFEGELFSLVELGLAAAMFVGFVVFFFGFGVGAFFALEGIWRAE